MDHFLAPALIFIAASLLLVPLFQRLGFGSVIGYLVAGVLVGPGGFGLIQATEGATHLSELGVVFLLFVIGLEIRPAHLWSMRRHLLGLGLSQVVLCAVVFAVAACWAGLDPLAAGIVGFGLSLSSTAFAMQTLAEKRQLMTEHGRASFSILLAQDLVAIPALALVPALAPGHAAAAGSWGPWLFLPIVAVLALVSRFLIRPAFRAVARTRSREVFMAAALFIVLSVSTLMLQIGLSAALGAFIAGVLLADSEYRHELEANLEPFKSLLMGLFFIAVGMGVRLEPLRENPFIVAGLTAGYFMLKVALIYGVGRVGRLSHENAKLSAINVGQGGEFAFVLFAAAGALDLVPADAIALLSLVITLSMVIDPIAIFANERMTQRCRPLPAEKAFDAIPSAPSRVIIAGLGRFGQIFSRVLRTQGIPFVAIDHDADQIELLRKFGSVVYYGDASRLDLLHAAGAATATHFVLAVDDPEVSLRIAETLRKHFPQLKVFARARNRGHVFDLMDLGIAAIKRETFDSSVSFVGDLLVDLGFAPQRAHDLMRKFADHDVAMMREQYAVRGDDQTLVSVSKQGQAQLETLLRSDDPPPERRAGAR